MNTSLKVIAVSIPWIVLAMVLFFYGDVIIGNFVFSEIKIAEFYDCAKNYDKLGHFDDGTSNQSFENDWLKNQARNNLTLELYENRCFITIESWIHDSDFEYSLTQEERDLLSYYNQIVLGEVQGGPGSETIKDNYVQMKKIAESTP